MVTVTRKKFEKLLKDNGFLKHKKYYFRLLNKNVFQTIGFVYKGGLWHLTFFSDILDTIDYLEEQLRNLELVHDGYEISELSNQECFCYTKEEAMFILNEEIMSKLNSLIDVKTHILFFENEMFIDQGVICPTPYLYYLYDNNYEKAKNSYEKILNLSVDTIVSWRLDNIVGKEKRTKNEFVLERLYNNYLKKEEILDKIQNRESYSEYFNKNYKKNKKIIRKYYGEKIKELEDSYDKN